MGVVAEDCVDCGDVCGGVRIGDVVAEVEEISRAVGCIPIHFLPGVGWVVHWTPDGEGDCHGEVAVVGQGFETEEGLELPDCFGVVGGDELIEFVDDVVDTCHAVLGCKLLDWCVPLRVGEHGMNHGTTRDAAIQ